MTFSTCRAIAFLIAADACVLCREGNADPKKTHLWQHGRAA
jgi:hypothetical protein